MEMSGHDSPRTPQKALKEDLNHGLDTAREVSINEAINIRRLVDSPFMGNSD